jgi:predicted HD phosphohydrolase
MKMADIERADREDNRYYRREHPGEYVLKLLRAMESMPNLGMPINVYRHSLQTASRCWREGGSEELIVVSLLHDIGEAFSPVNHGAMAAELLRPFVSPGAVWLLEKHAIFQEYYLPEELGSGRLAREQFRGHAYFDMTAQFCEKWDQSSFDAHYDEMPLEAFEPLVQRLFSQSPWGFLAPPG